MWQEVTVALIVGAAVLYLLHKVFGLGERRGPDVKASSLVRKRSKKP